MFGQVSLINLIIRHMADYGQVIAFEADDTYDGDGFVNIPHWPLYIMRLAWDNYARMSWMTSERAPGVRLYRLWQWAARQIIHNIVRPALQAIQAAEEALYAPTGQGYRDARRRFMTMAGQVRATRRYST